MLTQIRPVLEKFLTVFAAIARRFMLRHVVDQQLFLLEDLMALGACVDLAIEVDEAVNSELFLHFEAEWAVGALEVLSVGLLVGMNRFLVAVAGGCGGEETRAV